MADEVSAFSICRRLTRPPMVNRKLAPKACAVRSRLPRFIGLLTPSMPMPK
jgi:hypothetical protein